MKIRQSPKQESKATVINVCVCGAPPPPKKKFKIPIFSPIPTFKLSSNISISDSQFLAIKSSDIKINKSSPNELRIFKRTNQS